MHSIFGSLKQVWALVSALTLKKQAGLGWIDQALERIGQKRKISVFTRHYQMPALLASNVDLIATLPTRIARLQAKSQNLLIKDPPFYIPEFELKMAWCPLLHHHPAHRWLRQLILYVARQMIEEENREFLGNNSQFSHY